MHPHIALAPSAGACDAMVDPEDAVDDQDDAMDVSHKADTPSVGAEAGQGQAAKLQTVSLEADEEAAQQQRHVCATQKEEERLPSSDSTAAEAVPPAGMYEQTGRQGSLCAMESDMVAVTSASRQGLARKVDSARLFLPGSSNAVAMQVLDPLSCAMRQIWLLQQHDVT